MALIVPDDSNLDCDGVLNLVNPQLFAGREQSSVNKAMKFALEVDLAFKDGEDDQGAKKNEVMNEAHV